MTLDQYQKKFKLTMRERQTAALLARGCGRKEISNSLGISLSTVRFHVGHVREKIGAPSTLIAIAKISSQIGKFTFF